MENEGQAWLDFPDRFADVYDGSNYVRPLQAAVMRASHRLTEKVFEKMITFQMFWKLVQKRVST